MRPWPLYAIVCLLPVWTAAAAGPLRVAVSIPPLLAVAREIGGEAIQVTSFMTSNDDPHTFSPTPKAVAGLRTCDLFITIGADFEAAMTRKVGRMFPDLIVVDGAAGIETAEEDGHLHDPHIWLSAPNLIRIAATLHEAFATARPEHKDAFRANHERVAARYRQIHTDLGRRLAPFKGTRFYVYHPAFGYFARDYGLHQEAVEIDGKSPSPRQLLGLIKRAKRDGVRVVFVQPQFSTRPAHILAERIDGKVVPLDPLSEDPLDILRRAAQTICELH